MIELDTALKSYILSLLSARQPLIYCSKFSTELVVELAIRLFGEAFCPDRKALKQSHPDILMLGESDKQLSIEDAIEAIDFITKVNFELPSQLIIMRFLEHIRLETSHSLLKLLEESGQLDYNVCFISNHEASLRHNKIPGVLDTVMSRCVTVHLPQSKVQVLTEESMTITEISSVVSDANYLAGINANPYVHMASKLATRLRNEN